jgi:hypothetical protein
LLLLLLLLLAQSVPHLSHAEPLVVSSGEGLVSWLSKGQTFTCRQATQDTMVKRTTLLSYVNG